MELLKQRILKDGKVFPGEILKVDSFINHQMDIKLLNEIGREFSRIFAGERITKILTIEASGIGIACIAAQYFNVPVIFAKKTASKNIAGDTYTGKAHSYTKDKDYDIIVSKELLNAGDCVLLIDDFLAKGEALNALCDIAEQAGASVCGAGIVIEKAFQDGGKRLRERGLRIESLAKVASMANNCVTFED